MGYSIEIKPLATMDIIDAYNWYELQKEGLGLAFLSALDKFYNHLLVNPYTHSYYHKDIRHGALSKFPYTVVYQVIENSVIVYSVFMDKQNPAKKRTK